MKHNVKRILSVLLSLVLACGVLTPAFAAVRVVGADEMEQWVTFFNDSVNPIKTELPRVTVTYKNYVPENGITVGGTSAADAVDAELQKYLVPVLEGMFNTRSSTARSLVKTLLGSEGNNVDQLELHHGALREKSVPVYDQPYVSALTAADDFDIILDVASGAKTPSQMALTFQDATLDEARAGSIGKAFFLPTGSMNPMLISGDRTEYAARLDGAQLTDFNILKAKIITRYDKDGAVTYYGSTVTYRFTVTFVDMMNLMSAVLGYDFYTAVLNTVNTILDNLQQNSVSADQVLGDRRLYITYCCQVEMTNFNFDPRNFGDIDDDGYVTAADARLALRHAVDAELITASDDRIYADVDFDGDITAADARLILRMAVSMDPLFTEVPEGKQIRIVKEEEDPAPPEEEDDPQQGDGSMWFDDFDPVITLADIANAVFTYIGIVEGMEGDTQDYISQFIDSIRDLIGEGSEQQP